jgi:hypothetical protein
MWSCERGTRGNGFGSRLRWSGKKQTGCRWSGRGRRRGQGSHGKVFAGLPTLSIVASALHTTPQTVVAVPRTAGIRLVIGSCAPSGQCVFPPASGGTQRGRPRSVGRLLPADMLDLDDGPLDGPSTLAPARGSPARYQGASAGSHVLSTSCGRLRSRLSLASSMRDTQETEVMT